MRKLWARMVDRVSWRWNLPATYETVRQMYWKANERVQRLEARAREREARIAELEKQQAGEQASQPASLPPAQIERLALLAESCGKVAQTVAMALRYGWASESPYNGKTNRVLMERELGSLRAVAELMIEAGDVRRMDINTHQQRKAGALREYTAHQGVASEPVGDGR